VDRKQMDRLRHLMELEFVAIELNLFLDTHPCDRRALQDFRAVSQELMMAKSAYEAEYGPLLNFGLGGTSSSPSWEWINDPWPWEINWRRG
jgi:spore coat protein JB